MDDAELKDALVELDNLRRRDMRRRFESETLLKAVQVLAGNPDGRAVVPPMLATVHSALEAEDTVLLEKRDGEWKTVVGQTEHPPGVWYQRPFLDSVVPGAPRVVFDLSRTVGWRLPDEKETFAGASLLAIGLTPGGRPHVLLCVRRTPPAFSRHDLQLFTRVVPLIEEALLREADLVVRERLEVELRNSQKLEALGTLAAGIAHEINTPSQYVGDNLAFLASAFSDLKAVTEACMAFAESVRGQAGLTEAVARIDAAADHADLGFLYEELPRSIAQSQDGIRQISSIVLAMKEFSHPSSKEKAYVDLNRAIENTVTISRNEWKHIGKIDLQLDSKLPAVPCLPGEMNQVFLNLIVNAAHALADAGHNADSGRIMISTGVKDGAAVVRVSDNGTGIPPHVQEKIFDPFFTTKTVGRGTGQGLTIAQDIVVSKHGGRISFETRPGEGTTFLIQLPLAIGR